MMRRLGVRRAGARESHGERSMARSDDGSRMHRPHPQSRRAKRSRLTSNETLFTTRVRIAARWRDG